MTLRQLMNDPRPWAPWPLPISSAAVHAFGVADIAIGIAALVSFWKTLPFKAAIVVYSRVLPGGIAISHVRQALAGDFAANNFGLLLVLTVIQMVLLPMLIWRTSNHETAVHGLTVGCT